MKDILFKLTLNNDWILGTPLNWRDSIYFGKISRHHWKTTISRDSSFYIVLYSYLMDQDEQYPKLLIYLGYFVGGSFIVFIIIFILGIIFTSIFFTSLFEWILTISILVWIIFVAIFTIFSEKEKFSYLKNLRK